MQKQKIKDLTNKVEYVLKKYGTLEYDVRDDDIKLMRLLWGNFYQQYLFQDKEDYWCIRTESLHKLPTQESIKRARADFQSKGQYMPLRAETYKRRHMSQEVYRRFYGK